MNKKIFFVILSAGLLISCTKELKVFVSEKHPNGSKKKEIHYYTRQTDPRRIVIYGENGNIKSDQYMKNGKPDSLTVIYHNNGNKYKEVMYIQDPETKKEMKHGKEISWYENGNVKTEASFENGLPTGTAVTYYEDGKKASQVSFQNGKKQGEETYWYSNGNKKKSISYVDGNMDGLLKEWYENGNPKKELAYKKNHLEGKSITFHENGKKETESIYKGGKLDGLKQEWYKNGRLAAKAKFEKGVLVEGTRF